MLDIKFIRDNQEKVRQAIKNKLSNANLDHLLSLDEQRKKLIMESESVRARRNEIAGKLKSDRNEALVAQGRELKDNLGKLELELAEVESQWQLILEQIPNVPVEDVPVGSDESANTVIKHWGEPAKFEFEAKDHMALGESLGIVDMERAAKVSGARFGFKKGAAATLEWALIQFVSHAYGRGCGRERIADQIFGCFDLFSARGGVLRQRYERHAAGASIRQIRNGIV